MPRVSEAHLAARRRQILDAARICFIRNGFHGTSIQDVIREAGLSVGAVYRYFTSKSELMRAIAEETLGTRLGAVDEVLATDPLPPLVDVLDDVLRIVEIETGPDGAIRLAVQVWGEAQRDPDLAELVATVYGRIRSRCAVLAERARAAGQLPATADPAQVGVAVFSLLLGYLMQVVLVGDIDRPGYLAGVATLLTGPADPVDPVDPAHSR